MDNDVDFLATVSIFSLMKKDDLDRMAELTKRLSFRKGDIIIREGDRDRRLFIILSGEVEVIKGHGREDEKCVASMGSPSYFGEMALIDELVRSASVLAKTDTELLSLDHLNLRQEIERSPSMALELLRTLSMRIRAVEKSIIKTLGAFLPICANCKKVRDEKDSWVPVETYISDHTDTEFSHGICPTCAKTYYSEYYKGE